MAKYSSSEFEGTFWTVQDGDYYVSTIGNDITGNGHPQTPYLTVAKAFEVSQDGEKIVVGPNEYLAFYNEGGVPTGALRPCKLATTGNIAVATGGMFIIDSVSTVPGDRILVWKQSNALENGIYIAGSGPWQRDAGFNAADNMLNGLLIPVALGNTYGKSIFQHITSGDIIVDQTAIAFEKAAITDWGEIQGDITNQTDLSDALATIPHAGSGLTNNEGALDLGGTLNKEFSLDANGNFININGADEFSITTSDTNNKIILNDSRINLQHNGANFEIDGVNENVQIQSGSSSLEFLSAEGAKLNSSGNVFFLSDLQNGNKSEWTAAGAKFTLHENGGRSFWENQGCVFSINTGNIEISSGGSISQNASTIDLSASVIDLSASVVSIKSTGSGSGDVIIENDSGNISLEAKTGEIDINIPVNSQGVHIFDHRTNPVGLQYNKNYSEGFTNRSLVDKQYVDQKVNSTETYLSDTKYHTLKFKEINTPPAYLWIEANSSLEIISQDELSNITYDVWDKSTQTWTSQADLSALNIQLGTYSTGTYIKIRVNATVATGAEIAGLCIKNVPERTEVLLAPTNVEAVVNDAQTNRISWTNQADADEILIYRSETPDGEAILVGTVSGNQTEFLDDVNA